MSYIGNSPGVASQRVTTTLTATAAQTQFTTQSGYVLGYVDVYLNGAKLVNGSDFEAITGTYITLFAGAASGDIVELISYVPRGLSDGYTKAEADAKFLDVGGDTASGNLALATASLSGNLTLSGGTANGVGYLNGSKVLTSGSALTFDGSILATPTLNLTNALGVAYGGTGQTTANASLNALLPAQTGNATKYLQTDGSNTTWDTISISTADITGTLPTANGGTNLTSFTANGLVYASSSSALATGSALSFDGTTLSAARYFSTSSNAALPSYAVEAGSGIFNAGASTIGFSVGSTEAMRLTSTLLYTATGINVAFGTSTIGARLTTQASANSYTAGALQINSLSGTYKSYITNVGGLLLFSNSSTVDQLILDSAGNLRLGVTTPSAWASVYKAMQLNTYGAISSDTSKKVNISSNVYAYAQDLWAYLANDNATLYQQTAGKHIWSNAPSGIGADQSANFTPLMTLGSDGNLILGGTSPTTSGGYTSLSINNATNSGYVVLQSNGTNKSDWYVSGGTVASLRGVGVPLLLSATGADYISLQTNGTERGRFNSTGLNVTGTITENSVAVITQSDIGTAPNEIPLNQYLGNMAYQDTANYYNTGMNVGFRNRIINGAMVISQRGASPTISGGGEYSLDRFGNYYTGNAFTSVPSTTAPAGFTNSMLFTITTASASPSYSFFYHKIEGFNCADLAFGTSSASPVTLSFWVRSSVIGTYSIAIGNSEGDRAYAVPYTINSANTWEQKTMTVAGDQSGTWHKTNDTGIMLRWNLGTSSGGRLISAGSWQAANADGTTGSTGANAWANTSGATFYITGVQFERGSVATSFDVRSYGTELQLCQRYYWKITGSSGNGYAAFGTGGFIYSTLFSAFVPYPVQMRATPTFTTSSDLFISTAGFPTISSIAANYANQYSARIEFNTSTSVAGYGGAVGMANATTSFIAASAEL